MTSGVTRERAILRTETEIVNESSEPCCVQAESRILHGGILIERRVSDCRLQPGETKVLREEPVPVEQPALWSPETPELYTMETALLCGGQICDRYTTTFGIRDIRFDAKEGFFLNGVHCPLQGANVHQDHAGWLHACWTKTETVSARNAMCCWRFSPVTAGSPRDESSC